MSGDGLRFGPLTHCAHLCVDMQKVFQEPTPWHAPWMTKVLPQIVGLTETTLDATIFTRFIPLERASNGHGAWKRFYERWACMTMEALDPELIGLVDPLARFATPAMIIDKEVYSPWASTALHAHLQGRHVNTLVISGAETDICVAATVLGAIDLGYRVVLPADALCSSSDETHEAILNVYRNRYSLQIELSSVEEIVNAWHPTISE